MTYGTIWARFMKKPHAEDLCSSSSQCLFSGSLQQIDTGSLFYELSGNGGKRVLKETVRRDLRGVENRLKRFVLINCKTASLYYLILKGHYHKRSKKLVSAS